MGATSALRRRGLQRCRDRLHEVDGVVVDYIVRTKALHVVVVARALCGVDKRTDVLAVLHRKRADADRSQIPEVDLRDPSDDVVSRLAVMKQGICEGLASNQSNGAERKKDGGNLAVH